MAFELVNGRPTTEITVGASLDYTLDLTDWLAKSADADLLATVDAVTGANVTVGTGPKAPALVPGAKGIHFWLSAPVPGTVARVIISFTSTAGRTDSRALYFTVVPR